MLLISCHIFSPFPLHILVILFYVSCLHKPLEVDTGTIIHEGPKALYSLYETVIHEGPKALSSLYETMTIHEGPEALW